MQEHKFKKWYKEVLDQEYKNDIKLFNSNLKQYHLLEE